MLLRNRELGRFALAYGATAVAAVLGCRLLAGPAAAWSALAAAVACGIVTVLFTRARYRAISRMTQRVDAVLHGERSLELDHMSEGELAVLACEIDKMVSRLNIAADDVERERAMLADALADISHQLKTPLTSLSLMCDLVRRRVMDLGAELGRAETDDLVTRLRTMQLLQERIQWLVSALLKIARLDAGTVELQRRKVDAAELVQRASDPLAVPFDLANVELACDVAPGASFMGDPFWSAEALENVLKNCMEHAGDGGCVRVHASQDAVACRIRVEDTGPGFAEGDLPHVFERFYRGRDVSGDPSADAVNPAGVGIGLALAQSLVAAQGGSIKASNVVDSDGIIRGARFDLVFFNAIV